MKSVSGKEAVTEWTIYILLKNRDTLLSIDTFLCRAGTQSFFLFFILFIVSLLLICLAKYVDPTTTFLGPTFSSRTLLLCLFPNFLSFAAEEKIHSYVYDGPRPYLSRVQPLGWSASASVLGGSQETISSPDRAYIHSLTHSVSNTAPMDEDNKALLLSVSHLSDKI